MRSLTSQYRSVLSYSSRIDKTKGGIPASKTILGESQYNTEMLYEVLSDY